MRRNSALAAVSLFLLLYLPPPAPPAVVAQPNVVILMTDDQNVDSLPVMRKLLAQPGGSWINFTNAFTNFSLCCPARATILTGQYAHTHGVIGNGYGASLDDSNTLVTWLKTAGYKNGLVGKYLNNYPWDKGAGYVPPGWDYFDTAGGNADQYTAKAVNFITTTAGIDPFFLLVGYHEPHNVAKPLPRYKTATVFVPPDPLSYNEADVTDKPAWIKKLPLITQTLQDKWHKERLNSQRALLGVDDGVQSVVDALIATGQLDNTILIFMADHGFSWGAHRFLLKPCPYEECSRFPLFIRYPGAVSRTEARMITNVSLASTIAEAAGVAPGRVQDAPSLIPLLEDTATSWDETVLMELRGEGAIRNYWAIRVPGYVYIEYDNGDKELYDLALDPGQLTNSINDPAYATIRADLAARLQALH